MLRTRPNNNNTMSSTNLPWESDIPRTVLVIKKINDSSIIPDFVNLIDWLVNTQLVTVSIEPKVLTERSLMANSTFYNLQHQLNLFNSRDENPVDLILTLGGDGTLLYTSSLFPGSMPPVVPFSRGSLGFLTPHKFQNYEEILTKVFSGQSHLTLRSRLKCWMSGDEEEETVVMNEVVISRDPSSSMSQIDLHVDGRFVTSVEGDGLLLSTPTGSTAYSASLGASLVHPDVGGILVVPMNSHCLSSRPVLVPEGALLTVALSPASRGTHLQCSFDGRGQKRLKRGDFLNIVTSPHPVPCVVACDPSIDWFDSLKSCLQWNVRKPQKHWEDLQDELDNKFEDDSEPAKGSQVKKRRIEAIGDDPEMHYDKKTCSDAEIQKRRRGIHLEQIIQQQHQQHPLTPSKGHTDTRGPQMAEELVENAMNVEGEQQKYQRSSTRAEVNVVVRTDVRRRPLLPARQNETKNIIYNVIPEQQQDEICQQQSEMVNNNFEQVNSYENNEKELRNLLFNDVENVVYNQNIAYNENGVNVENSVNDENLVHNENISKDENVTNDEKLINNENVVNYDDNEYN